MLYIGVTNNIERRLYEHKNKLIEGYTKRYRVDKLIYLENFTNIEDAIKAEKKLKGWTRVKKDMLISSVNPEWEEIQI